MENLVIFDKPYPIDKQAEGIAIAWAVTSGACNLCRLRSRCECDPDFTIPQDRACMIRKKEILQEWGVESGVSLCGGESGGAGGAAGGGRVPVSEGNRAGSAGEWVSDSAGRAEADEEGAAVQQLTVDN